MWTRYGRVGVEGVPGKQWCGSVDKAVREYNNKVKAKTSKGYTEIKMSLGSSTKPVVPLVDAT